MGVYLYSQLLSGKSTNQMELAEQCFNQTSNDMDAETRKVRFQSLNLFLVGCFVSRFVTPHS